MLHRLHIRNYALIDSLDIEFGKGLNLITGETGAGKSIIMGALSLILGQRAENRFFFDTSKKCIIEGYFELKGYDLEDFFVENDVDFEETSILRRELTPDGKSRAFINDSPVNLQTIKSLGERLIDIHSQHATLQLGNVDFQLQILDFVSQQAELREKFRQQLKTYRDTASQLAQLKESARLAGAEVDYKQFLYDELVTAKLFQGEQAQLEEELQKLENAEDIKASLQSALNHLQDQEGAADRLLKDALQSLQKASRFLPVIDELVSRLNSVLVETKDIILEVQSEEQDVSLDHERLGLVQDRLGTIYQLQQKHRVDSEIALLNIQAELEEFLESQGNSDDRIQKLEQLIAQYKSELEEVAAQLRENRRRTIPVVEEGIRKTLERVGMPDSRIEFDLKALPFEQFRPDGGDSIQILFTSNKGQEAQPVGKAASGGELSRLMLAVKSLIAQNTSLPTIIFDEIDTGISGEVALRVGEVMEDLGHNMQVIAISHLPQIASKSGTHFKVFKTSDGEKTKTQMHELDAEARIEEIAQMLSGAEPGEAAMEHAKILLARN